MLQTAMTARKESVTAMCAKAVAVEEEQSELHAMKNEVHPAAWQSRRPDDFCSYGERKDCGDADR